MNSELVTLRIRSPDNAEEIKKVLEAVINAFLQEVVSKERMYQEEAREQLRKYYKEAVGEYSSSVRTYFSLKNEIDNDGSNAELEVLKLELEVQREFLRELRREMLVSDLNTAMGGDVFRMLQVPMLETD